MGIAWSRLNNFDSAFYYLDLCLAKRLEKYSSSHPDIASYYYHSGMVYKLMNNNVEAINYFSEAAKIYSEYYGSNHNQIAMCYLHMGDIYRKEEAFNEAIESYHKGLIAIAPGFDSEDIFSIPDITTNKVLLDKTFIDLIKGKAKAFYKRYIYNSLDYKDLEESYNLYLSCINNIPFITRDYKNEVTRLRLYNDFSDIYSGALSLHFELFGNKNLESAFSIAESGKSQLLFESIMEILALAGESIPEENKIHERQLRQKINLVEDNILDKLQNIDAFDSLELSSLENELFDLKMEYNRFKEMLENNYSDYYDLKYNTSVISLSELRANLSEKQILIEYALGDTTLFVFTVAKQNSMFSKISIDSTFVLLINEFRDLNIKRQLDSTDWRNYLDISHKLYLVLIQPLENQISDKELIIIPDKEIGYIPVEALISQQIPTQGTDYSDLPWLIKKHPISYAYSATLYGYSKNRGSDANNREALAFAPFSKELTAQYDQSTLSLLRERGIDEMELAGASNEVKAISKLYNTDIYFDSTATEKRFWVSSGDYNIIHIASHGIIDDENPSYSKLLFQKSPEDSLYDGEVHTYELFEKQINAQLVVLSACNTGMGKIHKSEGVMSLARGFLYTGVPSIVMTLWSVDDQSSAELMSSFYGYLKVGKPKDEALRSAKLDYLANTKNPEKIHPRYWAGYVLIGDSSPMESDYSIGISFTISLLIIFLLGIGLFIYKRKGVRK
ncbi:MAG: CHAT domain-containing tetratricopeptide repeat protein [Bacteroidales bacterium]